MPPEFTPHNKIPYDMEFIQLFVIVVEGQKAWRYLFCVTHEEEWLKSSKSAGDSFTYYRFNTKASDRFCQICESLKIGGRALALPQVNLGVTSLA